MVLLQIERASLYEIFKQKFSRRKLQLSVSNADNVRFAKPDRASSAFGDIHNHIDRV